MGDDLELLLDVAEQERQQQGAASIDECHLLLALASDERLGGALLQGQGLSRSQLVEQLQPVGLAVEEPVAPPAPAAAPAPRPVAIDGPSDQPAQPSADEGALAQYGRDLTALAKAGSLDPVIGRSADIRRLIQVLSRRNKNNPVLIGEAGVGKTAIAELLAQRMVAGEVPDSLKGRRLISLDLGALIAGAKFRGQFEERLRSVLEEVSGSDSGVVLFIDELHTVVGSDRSSTDAGSLLKPCLLYTSPSPRD